MITDEAKIKIEELACYARTKGWDDEYTKAVNMAVKALEQQPCDDCISREAVADTTICEGISCNECGFNTCEDGQPGCLLQERVDKLPPVTPQPKMGSSAENPNKWIPCSERLPEDNTLVLVTVKVGNREPKVRSGYYYMDGHFHIDNGDSWEARDKELIAWMPLPTPYQQEIPTGAEGGGG